MCYLSLLSQCLVHKQVPNNCRRKEEWREGYWRERRKGGRKEGRREGRKSICCMEAGKRASFEKGPVQPLGHRLRLTYEADNVENLSPL